MEKNPYPGKFIVIEGLDGSGQSTQAGLLRDFLLKKGYQVVLTKEPTLDSEAGKKIRQILDKKNRVKPSQLQILFAQDRKEHLKNVIIPALKKNKIVISDRYFFSSLAYGKAEGLDLDWLIKLNDEFLLPDLIFILKVSPEICLKRIEERNQGRERTLFEEKEKLEKVWQAYQVLPKRFKNVRVIEGEKSKKEVFSQIKKIVLLNIFKKEVQYG
jgi:dTMP kinase